MTAPAASKTADQRAAQALKIAYSVSSNRVGKANFILALNMCNALSSIGADVRMFAIFIKQAMDADGKATLREFAEFSNGLWRLSRSPYPNGRGAQYIPARALFPLERLAHFQLVLKARLWRPDALYTCDYPHARLAAFLRTPFAMEVHESNTPHMPPAKLRSLGSIARGKYALLICATTQKIADDLAFAGVPQSKLLIMPNAAPPPTDFADKLDARARLNIAADDKLAVYTGHLYQGKGVNDLIHAAARLPQVKFMIVGGEGGSLAAAKELARSLGASNLKFVGMVAPRQAQLYQAAADALVATLHDDLFQSPLKIAEYAAARRPIVATDIAPLRNRLKDKEEALFYKMGDPADLAAKIDALLKDSDSADKLAAAAFKKIGGWTWEDRAAQIVAALKSKLDEDK